MDLALLGGLFSIVIIDLVLSGDNALVIGMAAARLRPRQRRIAIIIGGSGAIVLRVLFTIVAALLLDVPFLMTVGGILLIWIAYKLLSQEAETHDIQARDSLISAVGTIILADVVMSLDNMLAVGGAAHGHLGLLSFGLALSMPIIMFGSSLVARLINRFPWLIVVGSVVLLITASRMIVDDPIVADAIGEGMHLIVLVGLATLLIVALMLLTVRRWRAERQDGSSERAGQLGRHGHSITEQR